MRLAELSRLREKLAGRSPQSSVTFASIDIKGLPGFKDIELKPKVGMLAICGGTGVGKTALLELIYTGIRGDDNPSPSAVRRIGDASIHVVVNTNDGQIDCIERKVETAGPFPDAFPGGTMLVGLDSRVSGVIGELSSVNLEVAKEGVGRIDLSDELVAALGLVCRKDYIRISIYEIEIAGGVAPLFEAEVSGLSYDSMTMSSGELSAFFIAWAGHRLGPYGCILIEEPEAHLPPASHRAIFGLIAKQVLEKRAAVAITTHSSSIASEIDTKYLVPIRKSGASSALTVGGEPKQAVLARLGLSNVNSVVVMVEDELSRLVLLELIGRLELDLGVRVEVSIPGDGAGAIRAALRAIPARLTSCRFVGCLDGDMRQQADGWDLSHPLIFLPFNLAPETELIEGLSHSVRATGRTLNRSTSFIEEALEATVGDDPHDRFREIARRLGVGVDTMTKAAMDLWSRQVGRRARIRVFEREFRSATDS